MPLSADDPRSVGDYRLLDRLGSGGMGVVYLGRSSSGRQVAVKVIHAQFVQDVEFRTRFRQEVAAARQVSGAFTAPVVDADPDATRPWMATLYVSGPTLAERLSRQGPLEAAELRQLALGLAEALHDIHRAGVVHRDLKPANVLMAEDGPRVIDFGISRAGDNQALTMTGRVMGTPPFMSPEQLSRPREVTPASDVFSLGALLVFAATGRGPFDADSPYLTAYQVVHEPPALEGLAEPLRRIVVDCLAKDPADRPPLPDLMRRLRDLPDRGTPRVGGATRATVPVEYEPTSAGKRRRRSLLIAAAAVVALGLIGTAIALIASGGDGVRTGHPAVRTPRVPLPEGWRPWQLPLPKAAGVTPSDTDLSPGCVAHGSTLFCGGSEFPTLRVNGLTGHVDWRARGMVLTAPADQDAGAGAGAFTNTAPFAVHDGLVYTHDTPADSYNRLVALHADSGDEAWSHKVSASADSVRAGDLVISSNPGDTALVARDASTGGTRWTFPFRKGYLCQPLAAGEVPYATCAAQTDTRTPDTVIWRLGTRDGRPHQLGRPNKAEEPLGTDGGELLLVPFVESELERHPTLVRLDPRTGRRREITLPEHTIGTGSLVGGHLFFVQESGRVTRVDPDTGKELWSTTTSVERLGRPAVSRPARAVYMGTASGRVLALDLRTGQELWQSPARSVSTGWYEPPAAVLVQGAVVGLTSTGTAFTVDPRNPAAEPPVVTTDKGTATRRP